MSHQSVYQHEYKQGCLKRIRVPAQIAFLQDVHSLCRRILHTPRALHILGSLLAQPWMTISDGPAPPRFIYDQRFEVPTSISDAIQRVLANIDVSVVSSSAISGSGRFVPRFPSNIFLNHDVSPAAACSYEVVMLI
jgi:hypothetical protein